MQNEEDIDDTHFAGYLLHGDSLAQRDTFIELLEENVCSMTSPNDYLESPIHAPIRPQNLRSSWCRLCYLHVHQDSLSPKVGGSAHTGICRMASHVRACTSRTSVTARTGMSQGTHNHGQINILRRNLSHCQPSDGHTFSVNLNLDCFLAANCTTNIALTCSLQAYSHQAAEKFVKVPLRNVLRTAAFSRTSCREGRRCTLRHVHRTSG